MNKPSKPTGAYIGRAECGCIESVCSDIPELRKETAKFVKEMIESGLRVERVTWEEYRSKIVNEPGFMNCVHQGDPKEDAQPTLFEAQK